MHVFAIATTDVGDQGMGRERREELIYGWPRSVTSGCEMGRDGMVDSVDVLGLVRGGGSNGWEGSGCGVGHMMTERMERCEFVGKKASSL